MLLTEHYKNSILVNKLCETLKPRQARVRIGGLTGSLAPVLGATVAECLPQCNFIFIVGSKEDAYYLQNDLETLMGEVGKEMDSKRVLLFPTTYRRPYQTEETDNANVLMRSEVVKQLNAGRRLVVVTYPEALAEKVISSKTLTRNTLQIVKGGKLDMDFVMDVLRDYGFDRVDFVVLILF